jgi:hypothetical protein
MNAQWTASHHDTLCTVSVTAMEVVHASGTGHGELAGSCSHEEFLTGRLQDLVLRDFGPEILAEVLTRVRNAPDQAELRAERDRLKRMQHFLAAIPLDPTLQNLDQDPSTITGKVTGVRSASISLVIDGLGGHVQPDDEPDRQHPFRLIGDAYGAVERDDCFYLAAGHGYAVIGPQGQLLDASDPELFGTELRIRRVYRHHDRILFRWALALPPHYPKGLLAYALGKGFSGRWQDLEPA